MPAKDVQPRAGSSATRRRSPPCCRAYTDIVAGRGPRARGCTDVDGRRWLDLGSGIAVTNIGHCHPRVVAAAQAQLGALMHTSVVHAPPAVHRAGRARSRGLVPWIARRRRCSSATRGAEAVDGAHQAGARRVTGRPGHRRLPARLPRPHARRRRRSRRRRASTAPATSRCSAACTIAPYCLHGEPDATRQRSTPRSPCSTSSSQTPAHTVAAMIVEPVLGEGGYIVPPVAWLEGLRERCDEHGILLVFDEVQTRHRSHGPAVRGRDVRRAPRRAAVREGHRVGSAARRGSSRRASVLRPLARRARTARRSAATRCRARLRWPTARRASRARGCANGRSRLGDRRPSSPARKSPRRRGVDGARRRR